MVAGHHPGDDLPENPAPLDYKHVRVSQNNIKKGCKLDSSTPVRLETGFVETGVAPN